MMRLKKELAKVKEFLNKNNLKWNFFIRSTIYLICCGVMFYQVSSSIIEYLKYNTVVQIRIGKPVEQTLPAISVCRQMIVSDYMQLLRANDQEFNEMYPDLSTTITTETPETDPNITEEAAEEKQWDELVKFAGYFQLKDKNAWTLFDTLKSSLKVTCYDWRTNTEKDCIDSAFPINSLTQKRICVTYFSKLYKNFNFSETNFNVSNATSDKEDEKESLFAWFLIENPKNDVFLYIHTSKSMPDINLYDLEMTRSRLFKNSTYGIIYSKYWVKRLEKPFTTDCHNYVDRRTNSTQPLSEFGCINQCKRAFWKYLSPNKCVPLDLVYILESTDSDFPICNCTVKPCDKTIQKERCEKCSHTDDNDYKEYSKRCEVECLEDCYEEYYQKDMFELKDDFKNKIWQKYEVTKHSPTPNQSLVFLAAKYHEELSYTHVPKTSEFDFFATLGGLFSLWIGASVLTIYDVLQILFKCVTNFHQTVKKTKDKLGEKFHSTKIRADLARNREIYSQLKSARVRRLVTMPDYY